MIISPIGTSPQPQTGERCGPGSVQISATGGSNLLWFPNRAETTPIGSGRKFTTPSITQTTPFYVQSGGSTKFRAGASTNSVGNAFSTQSNGFNVNAISTFRLDSVAFVHENMPLQDTLCTIILRKNGIVWYSKTIITSGNSTKIPLYWRLDPGTGYQITCENIKKPIAFSANNWGAYPLQYPTLIKIESNISGLTTEYPYIYNWVISKYAGCPSLKIEVKAIVRNGQTPETPLVVQVADSMVCSVVANQYQWQVNGQLQSNLNIQKIRGFQNSSYQVRYKTDSCWSEWSQSKILIISGNSDEKIEGTVSFYPNPTSGKIRWKGLQQKARLVMHASDGRITSQQDIFPNEETDFSQVAKGIYFLHWISEKANGNGLINIE
jgi:hypothetical protein